jgi:hypothetical protein
MPAATDPVHEPARRTLWPIAGLVGLATFFAMLGVADPLSVQNVFVALGASLGEVVAIVVGTAHVRSQVYSPATANEIMDADAIIGRAERGEAGQVSLYTVVLVLAIVALVILIARMV